LDYRRGATRDLQDIYRKERTHLRLEKDQTIEQQSKSREDAKPHKVMHNSTRPIGVITHRVVTRHIPSKP
jgi:hypothetical protein